MATVSFKCPNCGGGLQFDPSSQNYHCEYCLSDFTQEQMEALTPDEERETREKTGETAGEKTGEAVIYTCPSCGAEIVTDETTAASFCFYCHNPVILQGRLEGAYQPDYVVPFAIDKKKAEEIFRQWLSKKRFVPKAFYGPDQIEKLSGVYFPYWMYSCQVKGAVEGEGTKLRVWTAGNTQYTETQKYEVSREGNLAVNHVTRNALKKADKQLVEGVMPFDLSSLQPFHMGYLSGLSAEKRDMEKQEFAEEVESEVRDYAVSQLRNSVSGYQSVSYEKEEADIRDARWEYALLPVWTLTYSQPGSDKVYYFACNGQTGKICGKLPVDPKKLWIFFAEIFVPLFVVLLIVGYFL